MRRLLLILAGLAVVFAAMQLFAGHIANPPGRSEPQWDSPRTRTLAVAACFDCHSNQTTSRWYEHVAPVSWWIQGHVSDGRRALNFDAWDPTHHRSGGDVAETLTESRCHRATTRGSACTRPPISRLRIVPRSSPAWRRRSAQQSAFGTGEDAAAAEPRLVSADSGRSLPS